MERASGAAVMVVIIMVIFVVMWVKAIANYDPDAGCKPGPDCDTCPFPPCDRKNKDGGK